MAPGVAVWPLALPDGHWRCWMTGRCRLSRGVARHPRALPWGVAVHHLALPGGTWRYRNASKARRVLGLGRAGLQPRTNTSSFLAFRVVSHEWSQFDVSVKNTMWEQKGPHTREMTTLLKEQKKGGSLPFEGSGPWAPSGPTPPDARRSVGTRHQRAPLGAFLFFTKHSAYALATN